MTPTWGYALVSLLLIATAVAILWPFLDDAGHTGVLAAGLVAYPVQVIAFSLLIRFRHRTNRFLAAWVGGTLARIAIVLGAAVAVVRSRALEPAPTLLALAGFFFGMLLLEPLFFGKAARTDD